mmetsp:Transcript_13082/g.45759  ORF Transcript_13082/g.45759 Transcript_13082/m.45759 type:complete len:358 (-) Transcript_13082:40-1113(-)
MALPNAPRELKVMGVNLTHASESVKFGVLAAGALVCAMTFAALQEKVFHIPGFRFGGYMTLLTTLTYCACATAERRTTGDTERLGSMRDYALVSVFTMAGMWFTNWSLEYINYPMRVMFKSSKVVPVMLMGVLIQGRRYTGSEYASALMLAAGIAIFTMGDAAASPAFDARGLILISLGVFADALTANFEEKRFFRTRNCSHAEVMLYLSLFGAGWSLVLLLMSGELWEALAHSALHPEVLIYTPMFAAMGYFSVVFVLLLIKHYGATVAEVVKSCRKVFSICLSFFLFAKPVTSMHIFGFLLFVGSVVMGVYLKASRSKPAAARAGGPAADDGKALRAGSAAADTADWEDDEEGGH